jgi:hypothetical protein
VLFRSLKVSAAKVTTVRPQDGRFHFDLPDRADLVSGKLSYVIWEETERTGPTDTSRMLNAGAQRAFWLTVSPAGFNAVTHDLLGRARGYDVLVCESNSLRQTVSPGLFILVERSDCAGQPPDKTSVAQILRFPHEVVLVANAAERTRLAARWADAYIARTRS